MIYIQKRRTPDVVKSKAAEIINTPDSGYASISLPEDTKQLRDLFDKMPKDEIRRALCKEQHGLCAYCMRRIEPRYDSTKIEHYMALSESKQKALDYQNYLGVCYGGERDERGKVYVLCCDAARKEHALTINPWNKRQMEAIGYKRNGEIFIRSDKGLDAQLVMDMQTDLDKVLVLNGMKNAEGKVISDTASKLIAVRRGIYDSVCSQFERWDKKKCLNKDFLKGKIEYLEKQLQGDELAEPYIGVRLYFYRQKYNRLK
ncbi:HNH endonuclease family protein [Acetatifactor aquisgranensis]|uniref:hypothetical protein n=1 Tax=Acetatifactor aquisgranensis TaxID=2941233 RepID=UPI00203F24FD|nr:hypothetical protein [Acetatifactor aquisgranensis]